MWSFYFFWGVIAWLERAKNKKNLQPLNAHWQKENNRIMAKCPKDAANMVLRLENEQLIAVCALCGHQTDVIGNIQSILKRKIKPYQLQKK